MPVCGSLQHVLTKHKILAYRSAMIQNAVLSGYITTLKNKQKLDVSSEGPLDEGPSLETSSFCLFFKVVI